MTSFFKFLLSKRFFINLGIILLIWIVVILGTFFGLKKYTHFGEIFPTPNLIGLQENELLDTCKKYQLKYVIIDSIFRNDVPRGVVIEQFPEANDNVKADRKIFLTINAREKETVRMPDLTGVSIRQALADATMYGLRIGDLQFIPDIAKNNVIYQLYKGKKIQPGTKIDKGSVINLVVGVGLSNKKTFVPCLYGLKRDLAEDKLNSAALNIGAIIFDKSVLTSVDSAMANVWKQYPEYNRGETQLNLGSPVDIWLTLDSNKVVQNCDSIEQNISVSNNNDNDLGL